MSIKKARNKYFFSIIFICLCIGILSVQTIGDFNLIGLIGLLFLAIPFYILTLKDLVEAKRNYSDVDTRRLSFPSPTLLVFGGLCLIFGVGLDLLMISNLFIEPSPLSFVGAITRFVPGTSIFGFGFYLTKLSLKN